MSAGDMGRKRARHSRRTQSREKIRRESRDDRKLRTSPPGRLWLFTHSAPVTGRQRSREIMPHTPALTSAVSSIDVGPATRATPGAEGGHDKDRGADPGDRRLGRGLGDLREEPPASAGGLRYELRVSRLAPGPLGGDAQKCAVLLALLCLCLLRQLRPRYGKL
jgi:hypothetical protein